MKPGSARNLYQRMQSSDDSEEPTPPPPEFNEPTKLLAASELRNTIDSPNDTTSSSSSDDDDGSRLQDDLKTLAATQAHHTSTALERAKKTVMIEIKGRSPPGKDGVYALNQDSTSGNPNRQPGSTILETHHPSSGSPIRQIHERKFKPEFKTDVGYNGSSTMTHPSMLLFKERLIDTRKLLPGKQLSPAKSSALDRVKRLQERAGMVDMKDRIQERRDRCFNQGRSHNGNNNNNALQQRLKAGAGGVTSASLYQEAVAEKPTFQMDAKHDGVLKISDRTFCENGCEALLRVIKNNDKLMELDLSGCNIYKGDDLAQIVRSATSLKRLSLEWNSLGLARTGIASLSSAISSNRSLKEVDLRSNRIGPSTAAALAHALQCNYSLTCLDLRWNEIGPGGAAAIVAMLQRNHSLTEIRLVGNGIPPSIQAQIDELLEKNRQGKLFQPAGPPLDGHPFPEPNIGLNSRFNSKEMSDINLERIASLQKEIDSLRQEMEACRTELYDVQLQKVATDTQLETVRVELKEENLLRKFIEKETGDFKLQINSSKQQVQDLEDKVKRNDQAAAMKLAALNSEVMEAREKGHQAHVAEAEARRENKHLKDQIARIQAESKARMEATQERAKNDLDYKTSIIKRLEAEIAEQNLKQKEEVDSVRTKLTAQIKHLEIARDNAIQETERQKCAAMQCQTQSAAKEQCFQNEKEAAQKVFDGKINTMKAELTALKNHLEGSNLEQQKVKKKHASTVEENEKQIAHLTSSITKLEVAKSRLDEEMLMMTTEQSKLQERLKAGDSKLREMELKMEADRVKHAQALAHEAAKHLEDRKSLEKEVLATRRQIEVVHLHVKEIQSEQERRKFDTERRVTGAETAVLEWIHQQFASLKSALIVQHSVAGVS